MEIYTTTEAYKALGVKMQRLRAWIDNDYVYPANKASGIGTRAEWTKYGIYHAGLFLKLITLGLKRKEASELTTRCLENHQMGDAIEFRFKKGGIEIHNYNNGIKIDPKDDFSHLILVNTANIKDGIDSRLEH